MRRVSPSFNSAAYFAAQRSPEVAPVISMEPIAPTPVAVLDRASITPIAPSIEPVVAPAAIEPAPFAPIAYHEVPHQEFQPINPNKPFRVKHRADQHQEELGKAAKQIERNTKATQRLERVRRFTGKYAVAAASAVVAVGVIAGSLIGVGSQSEASNQLPRRGSDPVLVETGGSADVLDDLSTADTVVTTSTTTTTQAPAPTTTEAPAPTTPPETVAPTGVFERDFGQRVGNLSIPALCLNAEVLVYNADETPYVGNGNTVLDRLIPDPAPVDDCPTVNERVAPEAITRAERVRPEVGHVNKYVPIMGFERLPDGGYRHVYPCTTGTPEKRVNTALPGHGSTFSAPNADAGIPDAVQPGDTAVFTRDDGIECTYVAIDNEVVPFQGDDSYIIGYTNPNYTTTMVTYGCSDLNGNTGSADGRRVVHWGLVGSEINPQVSQ